MFLKKKPLMLYRHPGLYLEQVHGKGRGVFCLEDLKKGDRLEVAPVLIFPTKETTALLKTTAGDYVFMASAFEPKFLTAIGVDDPEKTVCMPLGAIPICNHLMDPNAAYGFMIDDMSPYAILETKRDIPKGEEITVTYGPTWFGARRIASGRN